MLQGEASGNKIISVMSSGSIAFKFILPRSPHFTSLWVAGVKSVKFEIQKIIGNAWPTYEKM